MEKALLTDQFNRKHNYLRISLAERCNLRCTYCMPEEGVELTHKEALMTTEEILEMARLFVSLGVDTIRLTGGEPLIRKDFGYLLEKLSELPVRLTITTNGVILDKYFDVFRKYRLNDVNISLDTLIPEEFLKLTRRNQFNKVYENLLEAEKRDFNVGVNVVLIKNQTENEILDFIALTGHLKVKIKFIEFMPFNGNRWDLSKILTGNDTLDIIKEGYQERVIKLEDHPNSTSYSYQIDGFKGTFGLINTVSNPFCQGCNRIRLTADGSLKNCLFSGTETPLLAALRNGEDVAAIIKSCILDKKEIRAGMDTLDKFSDKENIEKNRSMITIGG